MRMISLNKKIIALGLTGLLLTGCKGVTVHDDYEFGNNWVSVEYTTDDTFKVTSRGKGGNNEYIKHTFEDANDAGKRMEMLFIDPLEDYDIFGEKETFCGYDAYRYVDEDTANCNLDVAVCDTAWVEFYTDSMSEDEFNSTINKVTLSSKQSSSTVE